MKTEQETEILRVNRFDDRTVEVLYFFIEPRLNLVFAVVSEGSRDILYYEVCMAPFWNQLANTTLHELAVNPTGEQYETGFPAKIEKAKLSEGIFSNKLDVTKSRNEVKKILTGNTRKPFLQTWLGNP